MPERAARRRILVVGIVLALGVALVGIVLAIGAATSAAPEPSASTDEPVTATDFCYVESMIYYGVEANDLADALLHKNGVSAESRRLAEALVADQTARLDDGLRPWYVSWTQHRPLEPPEDGPCAGHGNHAQMPGMPTSAQWDALIAADGPEAERLFAQYLIAQNEAVIEFASQILEGDPNSRVRASAERVIEQGEDDIAALEHLVAG